MFTCVEFFNRPKWFARDEDGAVTVDWVVLTAAIVGIGLLGIAIIRPGIYLVASDAYNGVTSVIDEF